MLGNSSRVKGIVERYRCKREKSVSEAAVLAHLEPGSALFASAVHAIVAEIQHEMALQDQKIASQRKDVCWKNFELHLAMETGIDVFPITIDIENLRVCRHRTPSKAESDSLTITMERLASLIREALYNPLAALQMARDPVLPFWLQDMAAAVTSDDFQPAIRRALEKSLDDPAAARSWYGAASGSTSLPNWFEDCVEILGKLKRVTCPDG
jgi:hypothetical protein